MFRSLVMIRTIPLYVLFFIILFNFKAHALHYIDFDLVRGDE